MESEVINGRLASEIFCVRFPHFVRKRCSFALNNKWVDFTTSPLQVDLKWSSVR